MQQQYSLDQIQTRQDEQVVLAIIALPQQAIETVDQAQRDVPLKALLELEELAEGGVLGELGEFLARRCVGRGGGGGEERAPFVGAFGGEADLREQAFDLAQAFADFGGVVRGEVIEGEGEEGFHCFLGGEGMGAVVMRRAMRWFGVAALCCLYD